MNMVSSSGFCYSDVSPGNSPMQTQLVTQIQGFEPNSEMFNLTTGMELIGFFNKHGNNSNPGPSSSSSKTIINESTSEFYQNHFHKPDFITGMSESSTQWQENNRLLVDDSSLRCVFPCEANERPSQGLSLSLSSTHPSSIGLQSFELRQGSIQQNQQQMIQDEILGSKPANFHHHHQGFQLRNSKYLGPAQELLTEFCSLSNHKKQNSKFKQRDDRENGASSSNKQQPIYSLDFIELQKRKSKLLSMLEEVDRRYRHYCDQMKAVASSFETVAGNGAAAVYSALASKAMSRHFRCLRDGIVGEIQATRKAMGEKEQTSAVGTSRGETPRLRVLDQALRQQRAFQQMNMMENHPWRPQRGLPERSVSILRAWLFEHFLHPYPSDVDKHILARQTGLSRSQVSNWFINARVRLWKPMVEEMYLEEVKEHEIMASSDGDDQYGQPNQNPHLADQKPTLDQLGRVDSECLSSIITSPDKNDVNIVANKSIQNHHFQPNFGNFGAMELDFSSCTQHNAHNQSFNDGGGGGGGGGRGGGGVSLTLGLQQDGGSGVSLAFSPVSRSSLFYPRDQIEDSQPVQYSLLDGEGQHLPYRNLMGAQLLHDLAG